MKKITLLLAFVLGFSVLSAANENDARAAGYVYGQTSQDFIVIGDSISDAEYYALRGNDPNTAWWKKLERATGKTPRLYSERGSGYGKVGKCTTTTIGQRINHPVIADRAKYSRFVVVFAGVNDYLECFVDTDGVTRTRPITDEKLEAAVIKAMYDLDVAMSVDSKVYVGVPFGDKAELQQYKARIVQYTKKYALLRGFNWVELDGRLDGSNSDDGTHPNSNGSQALYAALYYSPGPDATPLREKYP